MTQTQTLLEEIGADEEQRVRVRGTRCAGGDGDVFNAFTTRFFAMFNDSGDEEATVYDSGYVAAYGIAMAGNLPALSGSAIATGMTKLSGGVSIQVGPASITSALSAAASSAIDLEGASGPLDFDPQTGEPLDPIAIWCVSRDGANGNAIYADSGQVYDVATDTLQGTYDCP